MKRRHDMPFGASVLADGTCRFRLWAPAARSVALCTADGEHRIAMERLDGGWFETVQDARGRAARYAFRVDGAAMVPDPASRCNPADVHGASQVVDPHAFDWHDGAWMGRPWEEAVVYELHVGTFTPEGTFRGVQERLGHLTELGVTAIELMPLADFPGHHGWGYDGVLPFAPDASYGSPEDLKRLVELAHGYGLMVLLDVVYNHFGPEGNYLHQYAPQFFNPSEQTPWGAAINFSERVVRDFFIHNALYWLEEFHLDGLRLDAVHAIRDRSPVHILEELAQAVHRGPGRTRRVHLVLENDLNEAHLLKRDARGEPLHYSAQWNDDFHHAMHVALTGESDGYYVDFAEDPANKVARCLREGFAYQGDASLLRDNEPRGEPSAELPPLAFVNFLQNHDQVGNRAFGERLAHLVPERRLSAAVAILLLAPSPPLLFMGDEFAAASPFLYFCDLGGELRQAVSEGRRKEFTRFERFKDPAAAATIPDPCAAETFERSRLDWSKLSHPRHDRWLAMYRRLLQVRKEAILPLLPRLASGRTVARPLGPSAFEIAWHAQDGSGLVLLANLSDDPVLIAQAATGTLIYCTESAVPDSRLPAWSVSWLLVAL